MKKIRTDSKKSKVLQHVKEYCGLTSQLEILGNSEIIIHGAHGIIEYSDNVIRISVTSFELRIFGLKLALKCLSPECLEISGKVENIEFVT